MRHLITLYIKIHSMLKDENGATMVEYSLMVAFIALVAFAAVQTFGTSLNAEYTTITGLFP